jgi:hypothetical protein
MDNKLLEKYIGERRIVKSPAKGPDSFSKKDINRAIGVVKGKPVWEVTRTWYVYADKSAEAVERSKNWKHESVSAKKINRVPQGKTVI